MSRPLLDLDGRRVVVEVPATTANLGAGFDCLGMALGLVDRIELEPCVGCDGRIELAVKGEGEGELPAGRDNRFVRGLEAAVRAAGREIPQNVGWKIRMRNQIPLARGLGSSAAATVGGLLAANVLLGHALGERELLRLAAEIEGHPDNAAAALLGGFVVSAALESGVETVRFDVPRDLRVVLFIPDLRLSTADMRSVLPSTVPFADAIANLGRVALGVAGLAAGRNDVITALTHDALHEPYRSAVYPQLPRMVEAARDGGALGACLSGAGSTIIAFADGRRSVARIESAFRAAAAAGSLAGETEVVPVRNTGARILSAA